MAWIAGEPSRPQVEDLVAAAESVVASELTLVECHRALVRAEALGKVASLEVARWRVELEETASSWTRMQIDATVLERLRHPFPVEPVRTLDAVHLASALLARSAVPDLALLSLDDRVRANGRKLGFPLLPADSPSTPARASRRRRR